MPGADRSGFFYTHTLPQRLVQRASPPTPPNEEPPSADGAYVGWVQHGLERRAESGEQDHLASQLRDADNLGQQQKQQQWNGFSAAWASVTANGRLDRPGRRPVATEPGYDNAGISVTLSSSSARGLSLSTEHAAERRLWEAHARELQLENQQLKHAIYMNALHESAASSAEHTDALERVETRNLRQQLACMSEQCQKLSEKMTQLQDQTVEAYRMLAQERQERSEERNNQLTVVVAKHRLERRMRDREQDLQLEWQRNAELSEKCQRLEEELANARKSGNDHHRPSHELPVRSREQRNDHFEPPAEDDWSDRPSHVPPEFGYSKFVRWKKRTREGFDHSSGSGKKQKRFASEARPLQLAGSESPPLISPEGEEVVACASAIDHMLAGEFVESETPSRARTPPAG